MDHKSKVKLKAYFDNEIQTINGLLIEASLLNTIKPSLVFKETIDSCNFIIQTYLKAMKRLKITEKHRVRFKSGGIVNKTQTNKKQ